MHDIKQHFRMFAAYNSWANPRIYDAAETLTEPEFGDDAGALFHSMRGTLNNNGRRRILPWPSGSFSGIDSKTTGAISPPITISTPAPKRI